MRYVRTAAPSSTDLVVTPADMRAFLRIDDSEEDAVLTSLVQSAVEFLDGRTGLLGRAIVTQTWRLDCEAPSDGILRIGLDGVQSVSAVTTLIDGSSTPWTGFRLYFDEIGAFIAPQEDQSWPDGDDRPDSMSVTFIAGYGAAAAVPEQVKMAVKILAASRYHNRESAKLPDGFLQLIAPFRRIPV